MAVTLAKLCYQRNNLLLRPEHRVACMNGSTRKALADNVTWLMKDRGWKQPEMARRASVSQRYISDLRNPDGPSPTLRTIEAVAAVFRLPQWALLIEYPDKTVLKDQRLTKVVDIYTQVSPDSREHIAYESSRELAHHQRAPTPDSPPEAGNGPPRKRAI